MADFKTLARPYAQAAFQQAQAESLDQWSNALTRLASACSEESVRLAVGNPQIDRADLVELFVGLAGEDFPSMRNFLTLLADYGRLMLLPQIAEQFAELRAAFEKRFDATIVSAMAVNDQQADALKKALETKLSRAVELHFEEDPELIGGAVIRSGDLVIDGSVRGELGQLAGQLS